MSGKGPYADVVAGMMRAAQQEREASGSLEFAAGDDQAIATLMAFTCARPTCETDAAKEAIDRAEKTLNEVSGSILTTCQANVAPAAAIAILMRMAVVIAHDQGIDHAQLERLAAHMAAKPGTAKRIPVRQLVELAKAMSLA